MSEKDAFPSPEEVWIVAARALIQVNSSKKPSITAPKGNSMARLPRPRFSPAFIPAPPARCNQP
ncbi:MAG: hypothetical protein QME21_07735 [Anaerolineales bacterium]|nr:hypothetical protein [Anaerolineales bacterium]